MLSRLRIRTRLVLGFGLFMLLVCGVVIPLLLADMKLIIEEAEHRELESLFGQLEDKVKGGRAAGTGFGYLCGKSGRP